MRSQLHFLLLDGFDPDTGELALRVAAVQEGVGVPEVLRLRLLLGRGGDPLQPLRRELQTHLQAPLPPLWDKGLKLVIRALEEDIAGPEGRQPARYVWVRTQILHPADDRRSTLNHPVARQAEILWDWAQRFDQEGDAHRALDLYERMLLLAPHHVPALIRLCSLLRDQGMVGEALAVADRWLHLQPGSPDALLRRGEALLHLERPREAQEAFSALLKVNPVHPLAHLGAAQAKSLAGGDPCPHLDAALELDGEATRSVLLETFDFRILEPVPGETLYPESELALVLGVSPGEVRSYIQDRRLPATGPAGSVRESELNRWVTLHNRYQLLPLGLHWMAPTPRHLPEIP